MNKNNSIVQSKTASSSSTNILQKRRLEVYNHSILEDFEELFDFFLPLNESDESNKFNLDEKTRAEFRFYLLAFILVQLGCCILLFLLNNWHYFLIFLDSFRSKKQLPNELRRTLSVIDYLHKSDYEKAKLAELEHLIHERKKIIKLSKTRENNGNNTCELGDEFELNSLQSESLSLKSFSIASKKFDIKSITNLSKRNMSIVSADTVYVPFLKNISSKNDFLDSENI